jgi:hypothetical protein
MAGTQGFDPDTQIQSSSEGEENKANQQLSSANYGEVRQNPQRRRNEKNEWNFEEDTLP